MLQRTNNLLHFSSYCTPRSNDAIIIIIIIIINIIIALQPFVEPWPLFQFHDPTHIR
jgi:hypothetical protein